MLANTFRVSIAACSRIVTTWILFLEKELKFLLPFSTLSEMEGLRRPKVFRPYANLRAILDCTEFSIEKPSRPSIQCQTYTVEPVLSGTVFSGHPLLSSHVVKSRKFRNISTIKVTFIERSPLLSGRGHLFHGPKINFSLFGNCVERSVESNCSKH